MTDKQIIIDGVDVSGCTHKKNDACMAITNFCGDFKHYCDDLNDCYYKQLQKLKAENLGFKILHESDKDLLKRKEQECEELKKQHQANKGLITSTGKQNYQLLQEYDKLKTALTEIKEIAESEMDSKEFMAVQCMLNGSVDNKNKVLNKILQKISECEGNNE